MSLLLNRYVIFFVVSALISGLAVWRIISWKYEAEIATMQEQAQKQQTMLINKSNELKAKDALIGQKIEEASALKAQKQKVITKTVTQEVIRYAKSPDAGKCHLSDSWVRTINAAAGIDPAKTNAASQPNDRAGTTPAAKTKQSGGSN